MAQKVIVDTVDDLDGSEAHETVEFSMRGVNFEIDLSAENAKEFDDVVAPYMTKGRRVGGRKRPANAKSASKTDREHTRKIRRWAHENGFEVSDRGRIPGHIVEAYNAAN